MTYSTAIWILIGAAILAGCIVFIIRKFVPMHFLQKHHDVAFTIFLQEGVIYGVLLAFVVSVVWAQFNEVGEEMQHEVSCLLVVTQLLPAFPEPMRHNIQVDLENYMRSVIDQEWKTMSTGKENIQSQIYFNQLQNNYLNYVPENQAQAILYAETLRHLSDAQEARRIRLFHAGLSVPNAIWFILIAMGLTVISLSFFFGMEHIWSQAIITGGLTAMITAILLLIVLLDNPFGKSLQVDRSIFSQSLQRVENLHFDRDQFSK